MERISIVRTLIASSYIVAFVLLMWTKEAEGYTGYGFYIDKPYIAPIYIDDNARIVIGDRIDVGGVGAERLVASPRGTHLLVLCNNFRNLKLDKKGAVSSNELIDLEGLAGRAVVSPSGRHALLYNVVGVGIDYIHVYRIHDDDTIAPTGNFLDLSSPGLDPADIAISPIENTVVATWMDGHYTIGVLRLTNDERLVDTGQRIFMKPFYTIKLSMSPDGRICANQDLNYINLLRIADDGTVSYHSEYIIFYSTACRVPVFTADGKYMLAPEYSPAIFAGLHSYMIFRDGGFKMVDELAGFDFIDRLALTPDEKYAFLASDYTGFMGEGSQVLSVARVYPDGTLKHMPTDVEVPNCFASVVFPRPWLLAEYGVEGDELADFGGWSAGGAPASYLLPAMKHGSSGMPELRASSPGPCFGFWQSPEDASMIVPRSLYRARFVVSTEGESSGEKELISADENPGSSSTPLPTLRMRIGTQNQHQAATLSLNAQSDDWLAPTPEGSAYEVLIEPPFSLLRQEEDLDDLFLALDLLGFAPDADTTTTIVLEKAWMDRIPIDALTTAALVCDYSFESDPEGWTSGGARELLSEPIARWTKGALVLEATSNTDCFGFWQNPAADIVTSTGKELYRATFEVRRTGVTDIVHVPVFRLRLNSDDGKLAATLAVGGTPCEEEPEWTALKSYALYYLKPETAEPLALRLAFDLLNYDPYAAPNATLELHHVTMERLQLPCFPMDR